MIISRIVGGLGNQMFQYALGRKLALQNKTELYIDISAFKKYKKHEYSLEHLNIKSKELPSDLVKKIKNQNTLSSKFLSFLTQRKKMFTFIKEPQFSFCPEILEAKDNSVLDGYWQSEKYFKDIRGILLEDFSLKTEISETARNISKNIKKQLSVSIHIRRGDYITDQKANNIFGTPSISYYEECLQILEDKIGKFHLFVFSNDMDWVKENLKTHYQTTYVQGTQNYEDLHLMSLCKHNIIANSTFSWWAAWLNQNNEKMIFAPKIWFKSQIFPEADLVPKEWIRV